MPVSGKSLSLRHKNRWYTEGVLPIFISMRSEDPKFMPVSGKSLSLSNTKIR